MYSNYIKTIKDPISLPEFIQFYEPEQWKDIDNLYDIKPYYKISTYGRVFSKYSNNFISPRIMGHGYHMVTLMTNNGNIDVLIHRLVKLVFSPIDNPDMYQVNHVDGNSLNNYIYNLEWCDNEYNNIHKLHMNRIRIMNYLSGLSFQISSDEKMVIDICRLLEQNKSYEEISIILKGDKDDPFIKNMITPIKNKANWNYISDFFNVDIKNNMRCSFTNDQIIELCKLFSEGKSNSECFDILGLDINKRKNYMVTIGKIRRRERYNEITSQYIW